MKNKKKIIVAMSGGVDSSVAAALLKRADFDVVGIFMKLHKNSEESQKKARLVAKKLGIPFYVFNFEKEFKKRVVDYFLKEYKAGRTPNPCVVCNKRIKFGLLLEKALKLNADCIATGHYAKIKNGRLFKGKDEKKDQSYFLWQLNQKQLKRIFFPIGDYTKGEVRELAKKFKLPVARTLESQEICFIFGTINDFLAKHLKSKPGKIVDIKGKTLGKHKGLHFYTIGQRKGIELAQGPFYAVAKDLKRNTLIVSKNEKNLLKKELVAKDVNWVSGQAPKFPLKARVKIRYRSELVPAIIRKLQITDYKLRFSAPQRAITPGQSIVFYSSKGELIGGGIIDN